MVKPNPQVNERGADESAPAFPMGLAGVKKGSPSKSNSIPQLGAM